MSYREYGMKLDCDKQRCEETLGFRHSDESYVRAWNTRLEGPPPLDEEPGINNHVAIWVYRDIPDWQTLEIG